MLNNDEQGGQPQRQISGERRSTYYIGLVLMVIGFLTFFSVFISAALSFGNPMMMETNPGGIFVRAIVGMGMIILGGVLMNVGQRGLAGSGVVLDPQQARQDLEPWSRMAGGMVNDALDETGLRPGSQSQPAPGGELPFDEKLRRLEKLRQDALITEDEFREKRKEILGENW